MAVHQFRFAARGAPVSRLFYASWSGDGSGPKFGPKRADTRRNQPRHERTMAPLKRLLYVTFRHETISEGTPAAGFQDRCLKPLGHPS